MLSEITENGFIFNSAGEAFTLLFPQPRILAISAQAIVKGRRSHFGAHFGV
jgi:hypothetical protein